MCRLILEAHYYKVTMVHYASSCIHQQERMIFCAKAKRAL